MAVQPMFADQPQMVPPTGFELTLFTLRERVYSPSLDHRPSSSPKKWWPMPDSNRHALASKAF